ncbi:MAG TPA: hypothetical protein VIV60_22610 [Polyangiaceae bacterium]
MSQRTVNSRIRLKPPLGERACLAAAGMFRHESSLLVHVAARGSNRAVLSSGVLFPKVREESS